MTHGERHAHHWEPLTKGGGFRALAALRAAGEIGGFGLGVNEWEVARDALPDHTRHGRSAMIPIDSDVDASRLERQRPQAADDKRSNCWALTCTPSPAAQVGFPSG